MDRVMNYAGAIPLETDLLNTNKNVMVALGYLAQSVLGSSTLFDGLACTATAPASLQVSVAAGSCYSVAAVDGSAFSSLTSDSHQIVKQGISKDAVLLSCPAPTTSGFSINYLVQAEYADSDGGSTILPFYNATNPNVAYSGPGNSGAASNTVRKGTIVLQAKAGAAATTGTQTTPSPDAGYTGLYVVTVANGQTQITSGNIALVAGAPLISEKLTAKISQATGDARYQLIGNTRSKLTANTTFYVAPSTASPAGNDANSGTAGSPWLTLQHAWDTLVNTYDLGGFTATIQIGDGTYTGGIAGNSPTNGLIVIQGNASTPTSVMVALTGGNVFSFSNSGTPITIKNLQLSTSGGASGIVSAQNAQVTVNGVTFGSVIAGNMCYATASGIINIISATVPGSAANFCSTDGGAKIFAAGSGITIVGTPNFSGQFVVAVNLSTQLWMGASISGSAAGTRYQANQNSVINTNGGGANFFPGNVTGGTSSGGVYV